MPKERGPAVPVVSQTGTSITTLRNHRIIEWFGLEGILKVIWFQPPCHEQGHLPPDQVAQSPIQPGLEHCQGGGSHSFSGQPVPVPHHPHSKEFLPCIYSKPTLFLFKTITLCPTTTGPCNKSLSGLLLGPLQALEGCYKVTLEPFLQAEQPQLSACVHRRGAPAL